MTELTIVILSYVIGFVCGGLLAKWAIKDNQFELEEKIRELTKVKTIVDDKHIRNIVIEIMKYDWSGINKHEVKSVVNSFVSKIMEVIK